MKQLTIMPDLRKMRIPLKHHLLLFCSLVLFFESPLQAQEQSGEFPSTHVLEVEEGVDLHIVEWGGNGKPLLFLPSWSATSHVFDNFAPKFTDAYRVVVMNKRGHGSSSRPDHGYTLDRLTKDIEVVLEKLDIQRVTLIGLSRSASLITQFAAMYPERVESLIYLSGPIDRPYRRAFREQLEMNKTSERWREIDNSIKSLCNIDDEETRFPEGSFDEGADEVGVEWRNTDPSPPYSEIKVPAIAFWSLRMDRVHFYMRSCSNAEDQQKARELIKRLISVSFPYFEVQAHDLGLFEQKMENGVIRIIPGASYYTYHSHPELVEEEIRSFLNKNVNK